MIATAVQTERRGIERLLHDYAAMCRLDTERPTPRERLEDELGPELAQMLVGALVGRSGRRRHPVRYDAGPGGSCP